MLVHQAPPEFARLGPLPVRVRTDTGEVVGTGVTGAPIAVPVGSYYVTVQIPDGREIGADRKVRAVASGSTDASPPIATPSKPLAAVEAMPLGPIAAADTISASIWKGGWLDALARDLVGRRPDVPNQITLSTRSPLIIPHEDGHDTLVILRLADRVRCTIVPFDGSIGRREPRDIAVLLATGLDDPLIDFRSTVCEETNGLLGFVESGVLTDMMTVTRDQVRRGDQALSGEGASILRAITGAYVLLRANALEGVDSWLDQLEPLSDDLPDIWPLRMELHARQGDHARAVQALAAGIDGGRCPWFRAGLSYVLERLRLYVDVTENNDAPFNLGERDYREFRKAWDGLERLLPLMVTSRYIATFDLPRQGPVRL